MLDELLYYESDLKIEEHLEQGHERAARGRGHPLPRVA